ncbi:MAG: glycosyltransferase family 39 protein [Gemmatimonadetes bacterium]|nr:glycosyltransferase family 39 protein [Gemmatimonadota bacterium]
MNAASASPSWLDSRGAPVVLGALCALAVWAVWGFSLRPWPVMHDEWAYWTQAGQYAALQWSQPAPPMPEFFEQLYVLVTPVFAAKYWPGHAMLMAPGFALGLPALMPLAMTAASGALVFALARRCANARIALLTVALWATTFGNLRFRAAYFSETTSSLMWLVAWYALLRWRESRRSSWMAVVAVATGWGAITRPATMLLFAIPIGVLVIRDAFERRDARQLAFGVLCGTAVLGILPVWSARVTGRAATTPLAAYTTAYLPFDVPGYRVDTTPATRALPAEMERVRGFLREIKQDQVRDGALRTFVARVWLVLHDAFDRWRLPFLIPFVFGVALAVRGRDRHVAFALGTSALLIVGYLTQAHTADWSVYYLEAYPAFAFTAAVGAAALWSKRAAALDRHRRALLGVAGVALGATMAVDVWVARDTLARIAARTERFRADVAALPAERKVVFVRYAPAERRNMHLSLVANDGMLDNAATWIVHDRGEDNVQLVAAAGGRTPFLYDEAANAFTEMRR